MEYDTKTIFDSEQKPILYQKVDLGILNEDKMYELSDQIIKICEWCDGKCKDCKRRFI